MYSMISYWLKFYRHECGLTQQQVADRLKIERSTYTYYETGKTKPDIGTLIKISIPNPQSPIPNPQSPYD